MTIRHMLIFRSVCENGYNSTKAAEALHMTQPAVSLAIKELEQYYGVHLFDRICIRRSPTAAGAVLNGRSAELRRPVRTCSILS